MGLGMDTEARDLLIKQLLDEMYDKLKEAKRYGESCASVRWHAKHLGSYPYVDGSGPNHL
jgi:hypothetical protein